MVEYTPQTRWIEGHGRCIWLAEVMGMLGGGLWLVSLYFHSLTGLCEAWVIAVVFKGLLHMAHLGHPSRSWRLVTKPRSSWLARGLLFIAIFAAAGVVQLVLSTFLPGSGLETFFEVVTAVLAFLVAIYSGFVMSSVNGLPFWNSALLPLLFVSFAVTGGLALMLLFGRPGADLAPAIRLIELFLAVSAFLFLLHLFSAAYSAPAASRSVAELLRGSLVLPLWVGLFLVGLAVPAAVTVYFAVTGAVAYLPAAVMSVAALVGVFSFDYCLLKAALYRPLAPGSP